MLWLVAAVSPAATPVITGASPDPIDAGGPYFLLTVNGSGFALGATVHLGADALPTTFISATELKAAITPETRALSGHPNLSVLNADGGTSNPRPLHISPVLSSVSPSSILSGSAPLTITLRGIGFTGSTMLLWNAPGKPATITPTLVNSSKLTAVIPANLLATAVASSIQVAEPAGDIYSVSLPFNVVTTPAIIALSPNPVDAGGAYFRLAVIGIGFVPSSLVKLAGVVLDTTYVSATQLLGAIPAELRALAGTFPVTVEHLGLATSAATPFTVSPVLFSLEPATAPAGGPAVTLSVSGAGFTLNSVISFNGAAMATTYVSTTALSALLPAGVLRSPGLATVQVNDAAGAGHSAPTRFTIVAVPAPAIQSISPTTTRAGSGAFTLTVTGANCPAGCDLHWKGTALATAHPDTTTMTATVPAALVTSAGSTTVQLMNQYGTLSNPVMFTVNPDAAVLTALNPPSVTTGSPAFQLTVSGNGFVAGSVVVWNATQLATTFVSAARLIGFVPSDLLTQQAGVSAGITVVSPGGAVSNALPFGLDPPRPGILSLTPAAAPAGSDALEIVVTGANFAVNCVARWNGVGVAASFTDAAHLTVSVPGSMLGTPGVFPITVTNPSGLSTPGVAFAVVAATPIASGLTPAGAEAGKPAFSMTVSGALFTPASVVLWNGAALATTYLGNSRLAATVPANLPAGPASVAVSNPGGLVSAPLAFQVTVAAPVTAPEPAIAAGGIVNAFGDRAGIAPGSLISIYGANFAPAEARATALPLPVALGSVSVSIGGFPAPLLFVSATQLNAQVPFEVPPGPATVTVRIGSVQSAPARIEIAAMAPALLTGAGRHAIAVNYPGGTLNAPSQPTRPGTYAVLYATGQGLLDRPVENGDGPPAGAPSLPRAPVSATLGGLPVEVTFAGLAPGFAGLLQINILVPPVPSGEQPFEFTLGKVSAPTAWLWVGPDF
ncbi:MAG: IPT/TIG domain-containing protein [Candidatus Solibacter sp.]